MLKVDTTKVLGFFISDERQKATAQMDLSANVARVASSEDSALTVAPSDRDVRLETVFRRVRQIP